MNYQERQKRKAMLARTFIAMKDAKKRDLATQLQLTPSELSAMLHGTMSIDDVTFKTLLDLLDLDDKTKERVLNSVSCD